MSADVLTQILGITGAITGVLALLVSYRTYSAARPNLKVLTKKCNHFYRTPTSNNITFHPQLSISNLGDRPTTLNKIEAEFTVNGKVYSAKQDIERVECDEETGETLSTSKISVEPHSTIDKFIYLEINAEGEQQEKIQCTFKLYHTHGIYILVATSVKD
jgi:hypothetical protein